MIIIARTSKSTTEIGVVGIQRLVVRCYPNTTINTYYNSNNSYYFDRNENNNNINDNNSSRTNNRGIKLSGTAHTSSTVTTSALSSSNPNNTNTTKFQLRTNICLIGLPGSGKGFYGRMLSSVWDVPLYSTSNILRNTNTVITTQKSLTTVDDSTTDTTNNTTTTPDHHTLRIMDSGKLINCDTVSSTVHNYLLNQQHQQQQQYQQRTIDKNVHNNVTSTMNLHFIMDGYPRTRRQIELMEQQWTNNTNNNNNNNGGLVVLQIPYALHFDIPVEICVAKILGRRICRLCNKEPNTANVVRGQFDLPPTRPVEDCTKFQCNPEHDWYQRSDDTPDIITERIKIHQQHEQPIIDYYKSHNRLIQFTPYHGASDFPKLQQYVESYLVKSMQ